MAFSLHNRTTGFTCHSQIDTFELEQIFGQLPTVTISNCVEEMSFAKGKMQIITGTFIEIFSVDKKYIISPSEFSKKIDSIEIKGDGSFEGPWDKEGKKLANLFFLNMNNGSIIYLNDEKRSLIKKEGFIILVSKE